MLCPQCRAPSKVLYTYQAHRWRTRQRKCPACSHKFSTFESYTHPLDHQARKLEIGRLEATVAKLRQLLLKHRDRHRSLKKAKAVSAAASKLIPYAGKDTQ